MAPFSLHVPAAEVPILDRLVTLRHRLHLLKRTSAHPADEVLDGLRDDVSACVDDLLTVRTSVPSPPSNSGGTVPVPTSASGTRTPPILHCVLPPPDVRPLCLSSGQNSPTVLSPAIEMPHALGQPAGPDAALRAAAAVLITSPSAGAGASLSREASRSGVHTPGGNKGEGGGGRSRVDDVLDDVFQLLSLFYLSSGRTRDAPATYVQLVTIKQCLLNLDGSGVYTMEDLVPYRTRLHDLESILRVAEEESGETSGLGVHVLTRKRLSVCYRLLKKMEAAAGSLDPSLVPIHTRLVALRRDLFSLDSLTHPTSAALAPLKREANALDELRVDGQFPAPDGSFPETGQVQMGGVLEDCFEDIHALSVRISALSAQKAAAAAATAAAQQGKEPAVTEGPRRNPLEIGPSCSGSGASIPRFDSPAKEEAVLDTSGTGVEPNSQLQAIQEKLQVMRGNLERWLLTRRWTLREPDLWEFQVQLQSIGAMRKGGRFVDAEGKDIPGQEAVNWLLQRCWRLVYRLLSSAVPVSEALVDVHNQLLTLRRCLIEVRKLGGPFAPRELYPYQMKLNYIDTLRTGESFLDEDGNIPEGQAVVMSLLNECYDITYELKGEVSTEKE